MTALLASDLDRTLIYSRRFFDAAQPPPQCVEIYRGEPISFMTPRASDLLRQLSIHNMVVPTTTRTIAQYNRIDLPGAPYRYAITSNGGTLLIDGTPDVSWSADVAARIRAGGPPLREVRTELQSRIHESWVHSLRTAENLFCYLVVDQAAMPSSFVPNWTQWCSDRGWTVSQQGRKIYTVPEQLCKSRAVAELHRRLTTSGVLPEGAPILAAGDGALDAQLLQFAHAAIRPAHGELHDLGWHHPHVTVAASMGAHAAEDILTWFASRTATDTHHQQHPVN
ncbi:HAD family hydrolase [Mycobacterium frederiksbergense]|uniref:HAD family hydrolase n=1 Tax=Mycolicibacterium frederiksbergense TaxID=117567 RepID=UPI0021F3B696|nr:HAD family hydrolase [Mycolicibacterium frederiksbergense]MCV7045993.1 HAD family hydrolase [Mycolicibacterium frederiksbergense]